MSIIHLCKKNPNICAHTDFLGLPEEAAAAEAAQTLAAYPKHATSGVLRKPNFSRTESPSPHTAFLPANNGSRPSTERCPLPSCCSLGTVHVPLPCSSGRGCSHGLPASSTFSANTIKTFVLPKSWQNLITAFSASLQLKADALTVLTAVSAPEALRDGPRLEESSYGTRRLPGILTAFGLMLQAATHGISYGNYSHYRHMVDWDLHYCTNTGIQGWRQQDRSQAAQETNTIQTTPEKRNKIKTSALSNSMVICWEKKRGRIESKH